MDLPQYAELFLAETRDHLATFNRSLLQWERDPTSEESVAGIFRAVHTIKGMAASMGYAKVAELAHRTENLLDLLRRGQRAATEESVELLFRAADALEEASEAAVVGHEGEVDVTELVRAIDRVAGAMEQVVERPAAARPSAPHLTGSAEAGTRVRVVLRPEAPLMGARALLILRRLEPLGSLHSVQPAPVALEREDFDGRFAFRIVTQENDATLEREIRTAGDVQQVVLGEEDEKVDAGAVGRTRHLRVDLRRLDGLMNRIGELVTARARLTELAAERADPDLEDVALKISHLATGLQTEIVEARMTPVWQVFDRFPRLVRDVARQLGKRVALHIEGKDIELDRAILDEIGDPLVHLVRNAIDHGIEAQSERRAAGKPVEGRIVLSALRERATVAIRVADDGRGIDRARILASGKDRGLVAPDVETLTDDLLLRVLARPGFSTAEEVSHVSGRGVGIDIVTTRLRALGGTVEIRSAPGEGTTFTLRLPTTLAIMRALVAQVADERYALPITHVAEALDLDRGSVTQMDGRDAMWFREHVVPLVHLRDLVGVRSAGPRQCPVIIIEVGERRSGLVVDRMAGQQEIVVKPFDPPRGTVPIFSGATILADGAPALILDAGGLV
jgi:two-component system chemotaxis sensor kinase CheA